MISSLRLKRTIIEAIYYLLNSRRNNISRVADVLRTNVFGVVGRNTRIKDITARLVAIL